MVPLFYNDIFVQDFVVGNTAFQSMCPSSGTSFNEPTWSRTQYTHEMSSLSPDPLCKDIQEIRTAPGVHALQIVHSLAL